MDGLSQGNADKLFFVVVTHTHTHTHTQRERERERERERMCIQLKGSTGLDPLHLHTQTRNTCQPPNTHLLWPHLSIIV